MINFVLNRYTIYHSILLYQISVLFETTLIINKIPTIKEDNFEISLIIYIFWFIELLIYLIYIEIIELNFCGLSENIKLLFKKSLD